MSDVPTAEPKVLNEPLFSVRNHHYATCGTPPHITDEQPGYRSYFTGPSGDQMVFVYDWDTKQGTLIGGDWGWDTPHRVVDGAVPDLILNAPEQMWLAACWAAATGTPLGQVIETQVRRGKEYGKRLQRVMDEVHRDLGPDADWDAIHEEVDRRMDTDEPR